MNDLQKAYLDQYFGTLTPNERAQYTQTIADHFCSDEYNANTCASLVLSGEKTATCSLKYWYESAEEPYPRVTQLMVVTNWNGKPVCIIETTHVEECAYDQVTAEFAAAEGEGDKSLAWWRKAHWDFFSGECEQEGLMPSKEMTLVMERFKVVFPSPYYYSKE